MVSAMKGVADTCKLHLDITGFHGVVTAHSLDWLLPAPWLAHTSQKAMVVRLIALLCISANILRLKRHIMRTLFLEATEVLPMYNKLCYMEYYSGFTCLLRMGPKRISYT